jgi:hypothetical protein
MTRSQREELERKFAQARRLALEPNDRLTGERLAQLVRGARVSTAPPPARRLAEKAGPRG